MNPHSSRIRGFSLIELMVVMMIIGIIAAFAIPASSTILRGTQLTQASTIVVDQVNLARQYALSKNHPTEVRLIHYVDPEVPNDVDPTAGTPGAFRAIQIFEKLESGALVPLDKPQLLPQSIIMNANQALSPLIAGPNQTTQVPGANDPTLPRNINRNYTYVAFRFLPDGSTNLLPNNPTQQLWFVTLHNVNDKASSTPPTNYFTLQVDATSGTIKQFRPGV